MKYYLCRSILVALFGSCIVLFYVNCSSSQATDPKNNGLATGPDFSKLKPNCFVLEATNPVLKKGDLVINATWSDPHVLKVGDQFVMYISADNNFDQNIKIYRLISADGKNWTLSPASPVFQKSSNVSAWDKKSVETASVVFFKGKYYMFYTGYPNDQNNVSEYRVMMATSVNGIAWTRQSYSIAPTNPGSTTPTLDFRQWIVAEPGAVVFNDTLYVYFAALGANASVGTTLQTIGVVKSTDGLTWSAPQQALLPDQSIYPRSSNWKGYSTPAAVVMNNQVHLFFNVITDSPFEQIKIHHAVSPTGVDQWTQDSAAIFDRSQLSPWASDVVVSPTVVLEGNTVYLWVSGAGNIALFPNVDMGVGLAKCQL